MLYKTDSKILGEIMRKLLTALAVLLSAAASGSALAENTSCTALPFASEMPDYFAPCYKWDGSPTDAYILYPQSWGAEPSAAQRNDLHTVNRAFADIKNFYSRYAELPVPFVFYVTDSPAPRRADDPTFVADFEAFQDPHISRRFPDACWISTTGLGLSSPAEKLKFIIAHEVGHCLIETYAGVQLQDNEDVWFEGVAEFIANQIYLSADYENLYASNYVITDNVFDTPYFNVLFFQHYANQRGGARAMLDLGKLLAAHPDKLDFHPVLNGLSDIETLWHDFAKALVDNTITDRAGGRSDGIMARGALATLAEDLELTPTSEDGTLSMEENNTFAGYPQHIKLAAKGVYRIDMPQSSSTNLRASVKNGGRWRAFTEPLEITTGCEDGDAQDLLVLMSTTSADLNFPTLSFSYTAGENEECEEEEEEIVAGCTCTTQVDQCVIGRWTMAPGQRSGFLSGGGETLDIAQMMSGSGSARRGDKSLEWDTISREVNGALEFSRPNNANGAFSERGERRFRHEYGRGESMTGTVKDAQSLTMEANFCADRTTGELCFFNIERNYTEYLFQVAMEFGIVMDRRTPPPEALLPETAPVGLSYRCTADALSYTLNVNSGGGSGEITWSMTRDD